MAKCRSRTLFYISIIAFILFSQSEGRRCFACRSRGQLGDCRDAFTFNSTNLVEGVEAIPCASSWCLKVIEGDPYGEDHDLATERSCLHRIPPDGTERCGEVVWRKKKVFACFCNGDLCNAAPSALPPPSLLLSLIPLFLALFTGALL